MSILRCILPTCDQKKMRLVIAVFCALSTYRNPRLKSIFKDFSASVISVESCFVIRHCDQSLCQALKQAVEYGSRCSDSRCTRMYLAGDYA